MAIDIIARGMAANAEGGGGSTSWSDITGKPSTFPPSSHTHTASDITDIDDAIESAIASSSAVSDIEDEVAALSSAVEDMEDMVVIADTSTVGMVKPDGMTITVGQDGTITAVGGGADNVLVATSSTTLAELQTAYDAGKAIFYKVHSQDTSGTIMDAFLSLATFTPNAPGNKATFEGLVNGNRLIATLRNSGSYLVSSNAIEYPSNRETALTTSADNNHYPSSKAVVDYVATQIPDVATTSAAGIVQPDGTSITVNNGVISAVGSTDIAYGASDLQDGITPLATGTIYCYYTE